MDWHSAYKEFGIYLQFERGLADNSVKAYLRDVRKLQVYALEKDILPTKISLADLEDCVQILHKSGITHRSIARMISSWKAFYLYLILENVIEEDPTTLLEAPKLGKYLPEVLSLEEVDGILEAIDLGASSGHRDRALIEMLYGSGLRVSELIGLEMNNLHFNEQFIQVTGKGNKQRLVPIHPEAIKFVRFYVEEVRVHLTVSPKSKHLVFLNQRGSQLSRVSVFNLVKRLVEKAGISKNVSPHTFRHSFASHLVQNGADLRVVQELLGHESILTTEIYTHLDRQHLKSVIDNFHPRNQEPG